MDPVTAICTTTNLPRSAHRSTGPGARGGRDRGRREGPHRARCGPSAGCGQLKLSPQAQELPALGLSMVKPCFSMVSAKSIVAPSR